MPAKRYKVMLTSDERDHLAHLISKGKQSARKLTHARILLTVDESDNGPAWPDAVVSNALDVSRSTVERVREAVVTEGFESALHPKKRSRPGNVKFDGDKEAHLIAVACSPPPEGRERWTMQLLADKRVELHHFASISDETVRLVLKKTN